MKYELSFLQFIFGINIHKHRNNQHLKTMYAANEKSQIPKFAYINLICLKYNETKKEMC